MRNKRPDLNGVLVLNKPLTWTSAQLCQFVRKRTAGAKVGHAGTLDPLATGVMVLCLGSATKSISGLMDTEKRYRAEIDLAHISATDDLEAPREPVAIDGIPDEPRVRDALAAFVGDIQQVPPVHSAIWVEGVRSYHLARRGEAVALKARTIRIHAIELVEYVWPKLVIDVHCAKGTYIRSLARDLGTALGTGGMLSALVRTAVGPYTLERAATVDQIDEAGDAAPFLTPASPSA